MPAAYVHTRHHLILVYQRQYFAPVNPVRYRRSCTLSSKQSSSHSVRRQRICIEIYGRLTAAHPFYPSANGSLQPLNLAAVWVWPRVWQLVCDGTFRDPWGKVLSWFLHSCCPFRLPASSSWSQNSPSFNVHGNAAGATMNGDVGLRQQGCSDVLWGQSLSSSRSQRVRMHKANTLAIQ